MLFDSAMEVEFDQDGIDWDGIRIGIGWLWFLQGEYAIVLKRLIKRIVKARRQAGVISTYLSTY